MAIKFQINEEKAIEALVYIASKCPKITPFYIAKILFFAEKKHVNLYGRPIVADTFIAMPYGPVPSTMRDYIEGNYLFSDHAEAVSKAISVTRDKRHPAISALRKPNLKTFSESDLECLDDSITKYCKMPFAQLSDLTHLERAWKEASPNGPMDYALFIDDKNKNKKLILEQMEENAVFGNF